MSKDVKNEVLVTTQNSPDVVSGTTTKLLKEIQDGLKDTAKAFVRIGVSLYNFREDRLYKELGYKNFDTFVKAEFNLSKATAYTFINISTKFTVLTVEGQPTLSLKKEFRQFSSSQLVEMLRLDEDTLAKVKPTDTIRTIRKLKENVQTSEHSNSDSDDDPDKSTKAKGKPSEKDLRVPLNRLLIGTAYSFDEIKIHKPIIDKLCTDAKRNKDNKNYRVEINIIWDNLSSDESFDDTAVNLPNDAELPINPPVPDDTSK